MVYGFMYYIQHGKGFKQNENNNFYPPVTKKKLFINADARYMIAFYNKSSFNYAKIKLKMPTIPKNMSSKMYQTRYFSLSTVDLSEPKQTIQTSILDQPSECLRHGAQWGAQQ